MLNEALSKMPQAFAAQILLRGEEYFRQGQVLTIRFSEGLLKGRVKGSSSQLYDVHMDLKNWPTQAARCTCTVHSNCKHAAACLFALKNREEINSKLPANKLDRKLDIWLANLRVQEAAAVKKTIATHHLHYLITLKLDGYEHKVLIELSLAKILKRGGYGKKIKFNSLPDSKKQHFIDEDNNIVAQLLFKSGTLGWFSTLTTRNSELLDKIIATGRAFFDSSASMPIQKGEPIASTCTWVLAANGTQSLLLMHNNKQLAPLLLDECWYFDYAASMLGRLNTSYPINQLRHLLEAPPISLDQAELLSKKMAATCPEFPLPQIFSQKEIIEILPTPVLILDAINMDEDEISWRYDKQEINALFVAKVAFDYAGLIIFKEDLSESVVRQQDNVLFEYTRSKFFEEQKNQELHTILNLRPPYQWELYHGEIIKNSFMVLKDVDTQADLDIIYNKVIPQLKTLGWRIDYASSLYQEVLYADDVEWYSDIQESTNDFFSYQLGILVEGKPTSIVPLVADLIQRYTSAELDSVADTHLVKLPLQDGRALELSMGRIKPLVRLLLQFGHQHIDAQQLQVNKYQLILMQETELAIAATKARWQGAEQFRAGLEKLANLTHIPKVTIPQGLHASLREYQHYGLSWLQFLRKNHFNGVLADDMGLGKTIQALAHLQYEKEKNRLKKASLIVAPTSLVGNWMAEAQKFTPNLKVLIYHGSTRHQDEFDNFDVIVSTYGLIHRDKEKFITYSFYYLILDEAQFIKNARTKTTQIIQQLKASHRLCLTGTPLENHLGELWSLFHFLTPGLLGNTKQFRLWFRTPIEKHADLNRRELLAKRIKPFMLRRTKKQVAKELPAKTEIVRTIEILGPQRDLYEAIRMSMEKKVREAIAKQGLGKSHILLLDALLKLRQVCCDPRLLSLPEATMAHGTSSKLEALMELLANLLEEGRRVLVFSQFTTMLKLIEEQLNSKHYSYLKLTGQTQNRQALINQFQQGKASIFLISLKAGGTGLNLTQADTVIHYDPWWNPAVEDQATDRTHRIGQENPVFVYKLIAAGTVEETILGMQERKRLLCRGILSTDSVTSQGWNEQDLQQFFLPLI